ncbi:50S ribosomal protein L29 [Desulfatirhabdium butyrativorans]|uniref:50S ribosomal protein L29 n=1 Tax=Desulfatirhabdium butyrativorans TaxID=340467 RepID=UPI000417672D|nr:50S ribosomal protein L29 [Desulfatirhabdium butyrativorans]
MKASEIRKLTVDEMEQRIEGLGQEIFNLRFQKELGQLENANKIKQLKKDIARYKTLITESKR